MTTTGLSLLLLQYFRTYSVPTLASKPRLEGRNELCLQAVCRLPISSKVWFASDVREIPGCGMWLRRKEKQASRTSESQQQLVYLHFQLPQYYAPDLRRKSRRGESDRRRVTAG